MAPDPQSTTDRKALYEGFGTGFSAAIELVAVVVLGYFAGRFLDGKLHTAPWLAVLMLSLGAVGGFLRMYYQAKMQEDKGVPKRGTGARPTAG